jgi:hypothetical protein
VAGSWIATAFRGTSSLGVFGELLHSDDAERSQRAMKAMLKMLKLDINELRRAYDGATA